MANNYNSIAKYYDTLSRVIYQRAIIKAQVFLIQFIKDNDRILLVGGGTGWILEELSKLQKLHPERWKEAYSRLANWNRSTEEFTFWNWK